MTITPVVIEDSSPRDLLNRQLFVEQLLSITDTLSKTRKNACYAITGDWGSGKSFVLDMFEAQVGVICQEGPISEKYLIFRYNCWEYDYYDEPLIAIVASMLNQIDEKVNLIPSDLKAGVVAALKEIGECLAKLTIYAVQVKAGGGLGKNLPDFTENPVSTVREEVEKKHDYDQFYGFKKILKRLREEIKKLSRDQTVVFIVDELDRCLPEYTIRVLERLHHLFNELPNTQTVLSIDINQLEHTVQQIFGEQTDAKMYLRKFINFEVRLDLGTIDDSFQERFEDYFKLFQNKQDITDTLEVTRFVCMIMEGLDMRTRFALIERCELLHSLLYEEEQADYCYMCLELFLVIISDTGIDTSRAKSYFNINHMFEDNGSPSDSSHTLPQGLKNLSAVYAKNTEQKHGNLLFEEDYSGRDLHVRIYSQSLYGRLLCAYRAILGFREDSNSDYSINADSLYDSVKGYIEYGLKLWNLMKIIR